MWSQLDTVKGLAEFLEVTPDTVRAWIRSGRLKADKRGSAYFIKQDANTEFLWEKLNKKHSRPYTPFVPKKIAAYEKWHTVLDEFCWLLKATYASREDLKARQFRLDFLLAEYLRSNIRDVSEICRALGGTAARSSTVSADLRRGWYNELAYCFPLKSTTLGLTFADINTNRHTSDDRFIFPSWRIVTAYYALYFFLRSMTVQKQPELNLQRHDGTINAFKFNVVPAISGTLWAFPFDISWAPGVRVFRRDLPPQKIPHLTFNYASHPRAPYHSPTECFEFLYKFFGRRARQRKNPTTYSILDFLREFRVWANYIDIDNLTSLFGSGYRAFLDQNLSTILFFMGAFSELGFISVRGSGAYLKELQAFYDGFICNNRELENQFTKTPTFQRMTILSELRITDGTIRLKRKIDPNAVQI